MRKFKLQVQTSVGGCMAGPNGEMDWMTFPWTDDISAYIGRSPNRSTASSVDRLKAQPGGDTIAYGGGTLVSDLIAKGLLDELQLFVNPTAIGAGMPAFGDLGAHQRLRLVAAQPFDCGIAALHFEPKRS